MNDSSHRHTQAMISSCSSPTQNVLLRPAVGIFYVYKLRCRWNILPNICGSWWFYIGEHIFPLREKAALLCSCKGHKLQSTLQTAIEERLYFFVIFAFKVSWYRFRYSSKISLQTIPLKKQPVSGKHLTWCLDHQISTLRWVRASVQLDKYCATTCSPPSQPLVVFFVHLCGYGPL